MGASCFELKAADKNGGTRPGLGRSEPGCKHESRRENPLSRKLIRNARRALHPGSALRSQNGAVNRKSYDSVPSLLLGQVTEEGYLEPLPVQGLQDTYQPQDKPPQPD